jgi:hypothetical protein
MTIRRILILALLAATLLAACSPAAKGAPADDMKGMKMAPLSEMPAEVQKASTSVQQAYQFAVANPDVLKQVPCYCGCGAMGHTSNYSCYVKDGSGDKPVYDQHALGCSICVDITHDTARMMGQGKSVQEIKLSIDQTYAKYGPSNITK